MSGLPTGTIEFERVSRSYRLMLERNFTLKETLLRKGRVRAHTIDALKDVSLRVEPGTALGIVGANGAGKSTMLKLIAGILPPDSGVVRTGGRVVSLLELGAGFHPDFSGRENVILNASIHGISRRDIAAKMDRIIGFSELEGFIDAPVRTYSSGMYARLGFSVAAELNPDILLLDEILAVGDAAFQSKCLSRIAEFQRQGVTICFVSHAASAVELVCDRAVWLSGGHVQRDGDTSEVLDAYHQQLSAAGGEGGLAVAGGAWKLARIASLRSHSEGVASDRFVAMQPFAVDVEVEVESPTGFLVELRIRTVDGYVLTGSHSPIAAAAEAATGKHRLTLNVPALPLFEGRFAIDAALMSPTGEPLHRVDHALEFTVFPNGQGIGPVAMHCEWVRGA